MDPTNPVRPAAFAMGTTVASPLAVRTATATDLPPLARRWLAVLSLLVVVTLVAAVLLLVGLSELRADTLRNRSVGNGNRVVSCTAVALADPDTAARLPECDGVDLPG